MVVSYFVKQKRTWFMYQPLNQFGKPSKTLIIQTLIILQTSMPQKGRQKRVPIDYTFIRYPFLHFVVHWTLPLFCHVLVPGTFFNMIYMKFYLSPLLLNLIYDFCFSLLLFILTICYSFRISKFSFIPHYTFSSYNKDDYSFALLSVTIIASFLTLHRFYLIFLISAFDVPLCFYRYKIGFIASADRFFLLPNL